MFDLVGQFLLAIAQPRRGLVLLCSDRLAFLLVKTIHLRHQLTEIIREKGALELDPGRSFVDQVNRLVRKELVGDVTIREASGLVKGIVGDLNSMVLLIVRAEALQDLDRFFY